MSFPAQSPPTVECLGCGKPTDPLRAGHVAILDGRFRYFCGLSCKAAYMSTSPEGLGSLDRTADPPRVSGVERTAAPPRVLRRTEEPPVVLGAPSTLEAPAAAPSSREVSADSGPRARVASEPDGTAARDIDEPDEDDSPETGARPTMRSSPAAAEVAPVRVLPAAVPREAVGEAEPASITYMSEGDEPPASDPAMVETEPVSLPAPLTLRSTSAPASVAPVSRAEPSGGGVLVPLLTIALGVATFVAPLAGFSSLYLRLGLSFLGALAFAVWARTKPRTFAGGESLVSVVAPLGLVAVGAFAVMRGSSHAGVVVSTAGAALAFEVLAHLLVVRAESDVRAFADDLAALLDGDARKRSGGGAPPSVVPAKLLRLGDVVVVREGETLVVDGVVERGTAVVLPWVNATTEATRRAGDAVIAGLRVVSGELEVLATAVGRERLAARPFVGKESSGLFGLLRTWTPRSLPLVCVLVGAAELASNASSIVVVAASLAAGSALSIVGALATLSQSIARAHHDALASGIVFRDPRALEVAGMTDVAVLCSRGTVLMGEPEVIATRSVAPAYPQGRILALASASEASFGTPAAKALAGAAMAEGARQEPLRSVLRHEGLGVTSLLASGEPLVVGSRALLLKERISVAAAEDRVRELEGQGASVMLVAVGGKLVGFVGLQDALRPGARAAIQRLLEARVEPVLVSGETRETCETLARALDIEHVRPEVLPHDRADEVRSLGEGGHVVAVLGRATTDEGALAAADVSIALGSVGQVGDFSVVLASDDVRAAAHSLALARALRERARLGVVAAFAPTVVAVLGLGFGVMPFVLAPVAGFLSAALGLLVVRPLGATEEPRP
ncbi:MAG: HAD-IC family P-type ATPase [Polyangiaceae bacterium]